MHWIDEVADWPPAHQRYLMQYGRSPIENALDDMRKFGNAFIKFNTEGEKQMEKIDWHKPLQVRNPTTGRVQDQKVYTYKSGSQRVVWIGDRVYPVDDQGRAVADVDYGPNWVKKGNQIVENVPEEKFFLGLARESDGTYWLTNCGVPTTISIMNTWKGFVGSDGRPCWIVDTRKSAEPPKAVEHDPKDYVTIYMRGSYTLTSELMTKRKAEAYVSEPGEQVVRVRTTPAPVDTSRYIHLYRRKGTNGAWCIDRLLVGGGGQEYTWDGAQAVSARNAHRNEYVAVKVRD